MQKGAGKTQNIEQGNNRNSFSLIGYKNALNFADMAHAHNGHMKKQEMENWKRNWKQKWKHNLLAVVVLEIFVLLANHEFSLSTVTSKECFKN